MARQEEIIIEVKVNAGDAAQKLAQTKNSIAELKAEQKALNAAIKENGSVTAEQAQRLAEISGELKDLSREEKMYTSQLNTATGGNKEFGKSLATMSIELAKMKAEYRNMSKEMRESDAGKQLQASIQSLDKTMKESDAELGDFTRNVGNYQSALLGLNGNVLKVANLFQGGFKNGIAAAGTALKGFAKQLLATPLGWILAGIKAVTAILGKLKDAFKSNDVAGTQLSASLARLEPIVDAINKIFSNLVEGIAKFVNGATKAVTFIMDKMIPGYNAAADAARRLKIAQDELEEKERQYIVHHAEYQREISDLRYKAAQRDKYTAEQRIEFYNESLELERKDLAEKKEIARQKYNDAVNNAKKMRNVTILTRAEYDKLDDDVKSNLATLRAAYIDIDREYTEFARSMEKARQKTAKEMENEDKAAVAAAKENAKEYAAAIVEGMKKAEDELRKLEDLQNDLIEDELKRQRAIVKTMADREIKEIEERLANETNLTEEARKAMSERIVLIRQKMWKDLSAVDDVELKRVQDTILTSEKEAEERAENIRKAAMQATREQYEKETESLSNSFQKRVNAAYGDAVKISEIEIEVAQSNYDRLKAMDSETKDALGLSEEAYKNAVLQAEAQIMDARQHNKEALKAQATEVAQTMQAVTGAMSSMFEAVAGDSEAYEKFKKAMAIADAAISLAQTIAAATSASTAGDPYSMAIRIATNVAAVTAQFAAVIKAIKAASVPAAPKFAEGGVVPGTSYTGDKVLIRVNSGERVLTKEMSDNLEKMLEHEVPEVQKVDEVGVVPEVPKFTEVGVVPEVPKFSKVGVVPEVPKFADGGVVPGTSYTGDKVLIRANSGERVLTKEMSDKLVKMLAQGVPSWGLDYDRMEQAFERAASRMPAPVLDYSEFVAYGKKVQMEQTRLSEY